MVMFFEDIFLNISPTLIWMKLGIWMAGQEGMAL